VDEKLCQMIREKLKTGEPYQIVQELLDDCLTEGSRDNMTLILVLFDPPSDEKSEPKQRCLIIHEKMLDPKSEEP